MTLFVFEKYQPLHCSRERASAHAQTCSNLAGGGAEMCATSFDGPRIDGGTRHFVVYLFICFFFVWMPLGTTQSG